MKAALVAFVSVSFLVAGCLSPVDITTAYQSEVYLCDDDEAYAARVADCLARREAGGECSGVFSFEGTIDGVDVVVDTDLAEVTINSVRFPDSSLGRDSMDLYGDSPYFSFRVSLSSLGDADSRPDGDVVQDFGRSPDCEDGILDNLCRFSIRVIAGGGSSDDELSMGSITISRQTPDENIARFEGTFRDGAPLRGCFTAFTDSAEVELADVCP